MALEKGTLHGVGIVQDDTAPGVPVTNMSGDGGDIIAENAAVLAERRSPAVVSTEADLQTVGPVDGNSYQTLAQDTAADGKGELFEYQSTGRSTLNQDRTYYTDGPGADDYYRRVNLKDKFVEETDIAKIVQAMLDNNEPVRIPAGYYYLNTPLVFPYRSGAVMEGETGARSAVKITTSSNELAGCTTRLRFNFLNPADVGKPAITLKGSEHTLRNFTMLGATTTTDNTNPRYAGTAIQMETDMNPITMPETVDNGLGPGKSDLEGISIYGYDTGLQLGSGVSQVDSIGVPQSTGYEFNNDMMRGRRLVFEHVGTCIHSISRWAMDNVFDSCQFRKDIGVVHRCSGGGHFLYKDCTALYPMTMFFASGFNTDLGDRTGPNNRLHVFDFLKVDQQAVEPGTFKLTDGEASCKAHIIFRNTQVSSGYAWNEGNYSDAGNFSSIDPSYGSPELVTYATPTNWA